MRINLWFFERDLYVEYVKNECGGVDHLIEVITDLSEFLTRNEQLIKNDRKKRRVIVGLMGQIVSKLVTMSEDPRIEEWDQIRIQKAVLWKLIPACSKVFPAPDTTS